MNNNRIIPLAIAVASASLTLISSAVSAQPGGSSVKTLAAPADPVKNAVLIGWSPPAAWYSSWNLKVRNRCGCRWEPQLSGVPTSPLLTSDTTWS